MVREATEENAQKKKRSPQKQPRKKCWLFKLNSLIIKRNRIKHLRRGMFLDTFEHQRKIDAEERQKDRDFFLELRKIFSGNK